MRNLEGVNCRLALASLLMQADIARRDDFRRAEASLASFALTRILRRARCDSRFKSSCRRPVLDGVRFD